MRRPLVAGNWKMFTDPASAAKLADGLRTRFSACDWADVVVFPPFTSIAAVVSALSGSVIEVGGQNIHWENEGAYTGEVSGSMLKASGCKWAIVGHSERRKYFAETDEKVLSRIGAAIASGLNPIVCVGESLEERESGLTETVVERQIAGGLSGLQDIGSLTLAYEPVWAIGTGRTAAPDQAQEVHRFIRALISDRWGTGSAARIRLLYGGSVKPENAASLGAEEDIDGFLVGGGSLKAESCLGVGPTVKKRLDMLLLSSILA
jgi:triosephosphate isomerase